MTTTTFQELRHKRAKLYCPVDWAIAKWADFFADCLKLHILNEDDKDKAVNELMETYNCGNSLIVATLGFQKDYNMLGD